MKQAISFTITFLSLLFLTAQNVWADTYVGEHSAELFSEVQFASRVPDDRVTKLEQFLETQKSPLAPYAKVFVLTADKYELPDWKLVPAITGVESTFGKAIPFNSYNAYGWANGECSFKNWVESIEIVTKTLKEKYVNKGLTTPETIAPVYAPPSNTWAGKVRFFMQKIDNFKLVTSDFIPLSL